MTEALPKPGIPRGLIGLIAFIILLILLGILFMTHVQSTPPNGGGGNGGDDWRKQCTQWEGANEGLSLALDSVMAWFNPGGPFAGQSARAVLNQDWSTWKVLSQNTFGFDGPGMDYFTANQYRGLGSQVHGEWSRGICYPNLTNEQMRFVRDVWGN